MFGLFKNPSCPRCGKETQETNYAFPFPQYRCVPCVRESKKSEALEERVKRLERKLEIKGEES